MRASFPAGKNGFVLLLALFCLNSCVAKAQGAPSSKMTAAFAEAGAPLLRQAVPLLDFSLPRLPQSAGSAADLRGAERQSLSALKGKVVFLNFWATWCGPCRAEMPSMEALYQKYKDKGFEIMAVNCMEAPADVRAFMSENRFSFPVLLDDEGRAGTAYGIQAIPTTFLIDREGRIVMRLIGTTDWNTPKFHAALDSLLNS